MLLFKVKTTKALPILSGSPGVFVSSSYREHNRPQRLDL
jgi:hypothetical protein